ncbi:hypothetical protein K504DRAFT_452226 [Pleomassaria siparia CBS 279.74]|uniref:Uncharacterized protein n=1 Tax=Pleomassaria siparia CBS 279.74 TaxID=1314801 RepID=A0A6G1KGD7_9PLEO|nr:hypothetical protein K504DRAFT_452226 [Pleomassaria siparia CBS 279.74]
MQGKIKHSSLDFNAFYYKVNSITKEDNNFRQFCNAVCKGDVAKRETISCKLHPKLLGKALVPLPYTLPPISADTLKTPTYYSKLPKSTTATYYLSLLPTSCLILRGARQRCCTSTRRARSNAQSIALGRGVDSLSIGQAIELSREKGCKGEHYPKDYATENNLCLL